MVRLLAKLGAALVLVSLYLGASSGQAAAEPADVPTSNVAQSGAETWSLVDHEGRAVRDSDFHGRFRLVAFGYTSCPDICPTTLAGLTDVMNDLGELARFVIPVFVTVDPKRDTGAVLADYVAHFDSRIVGLTGNERQLKSVQQAYGVIAVPGPESDDGGYAIAHSAQRYLVGPAGERIESFDHNDSPEVIGAYLKRLFDRIGL